MFVTYRVYNFQLNNKKNLLTPYPLLSIVLEAQNTLVQTGYK